jgi:hypothetical protein
MSSKILSLVITLLCFHTLLIAQTDSNSNVHIGFIYPLSTNGFRAAQYSNLISAHALVGVSKNERAFCAAGFGNVVKDSAAGFTGAGFFNVIGGVANGVQAAGFVNYIHHEAKGLQAAGFVNVTGGGSGAELAGFINVTRNMRGFQAAGFINQAKKVTSQIAGFINVADSVDGCQIAGFINVAHKVKGVQIAGFINVADSSDYPIGLINIIKKGQKAIGVTIDESGTTLAAFRSGGKRLYGIVGVGFNFNRNADLYALQAGLGAHFPVNKYVAISGEASLTTLSDLWWGTYSNASIRFMPSIKVKRIEAFAGPSINYGYSAYGFNYNQLHNAPWKEQFYNSNHGLHLGFMAGVQYHL